MAIDARLTQVLDAPRVIVTWKPVAVCALTVTVIPLAASVKVSPGVHMAPASFGSPLLSPSTTSSRPA